MADLDLGARRLHLVAPGPVRRAVALVCALTGARLVLAAIIPLAPDEAYYWQWSRHLAAGYFDHPPAVAWLIRAGTLVAGDTPLGVRLAFVIAASAGVLVALVLARRLDDDRAAWRTAVLFAAVPMGVGLVLASPDAGQFLWGVGMLWAVDHALARQADDDLWWWVVTGVALGFGLTAKYTTALMPMAIALACAVSPSLRAQFRRPGPYIALVIGVVIFLPVVFWNAHHDWVSFRFQLHHGLGRAGDSALVRELSLVGGQAALLSPILFALAVAAVWRALRAPERARSFLPATVAAFVWGFFALSALRHPVEANWPALALLPALILLAAWPPSGRRLIGERIGLVMGAAVVVAVTAQAVRPWMSIPARSDPVGQFYGWDEAARRVAADIAALGQAAVVAPGGRIWVAADRYQEASELAFHLAGHPTVFSLNLGGRSNQYDLWPTARDLVRPGDALVVVLRESGSEPAPVTNLAPRFQRVERGALIEMHEGPAVVGRLRLWHFLVLTTW